MPRFVVLQHDSPDGLHWDLMLETDELLATWNFGQTPDCSEPVTIAELPDHRVEYLDYEGSISQGRGMVKRWDYGTYEIVRQSEHEWVLDVCGTKMIGRVSLCRSADEHRVWRYLLSSG